MCILRPRTLTKYVHGQQSFYKYYHLIFTLLTNQSSQIRSKCVNNFCEGNRKRERETHTHTRYLYIYKPTNKYTFNVHTRRRIFFKVHICHH